MPTLVLQAKDDPFMTIDVIPEPEELSPDIVLELMPHGGHLGFVGGVFPWRPEYWLEERIPAFLSACFRQTKKADTVVEELGVGFEP